jgi:hypothetical protein
MKYRHLPHGNAGMLEDVGLRDFQLASEADTVMAALIY